MVWGFKSFVHGVVLDPFMVYCLDLLFIVWFLNLLFVWFKSFVYGVLFNTFMTKVY